MRNRPATRAISTTVRTTDSAPARGTFAHSANGLMDGHQPDREVGQLFLELRRALGVPVQTLAAVLETHPGTIAALESGRLSLLPQWPETERVVRSYTALAGIDPGPVLARIRIALEQDKPRQALPTQPPNSGRPAVSAVPVPVSQRTAPTPLPATAARRVPERAVAVTEPGANDLQAPRISARTLHRLRTLGSRVQSRRGLTITSGIVVAVIALVFFGPLVSLLPARAQRAVLPVIDSLPFSNARVLEGMRWIDPADPRSRRSDKLQSAAR